MNAKASDPHDLYLHLRARAFRLEIAIFTERCCAGDDTVYGNGQKYKPLTDTEYEALQTDLERVEVEIKDIEKGMSAIERAIADGRGRDYPRTDFQLASEGRDKNQQYENLEEWYSKSNESLPPWKRSTWIFLTDRPLGGTSPIRPWRTPSAW